MRHLVNVGKTKPNKPKVKIGKMNITSFITMSYEQRTMNDEKNKPKQSQIEFIPKQGIPLRVLNIKTTAGINLTGIEVLVIVRGGNMQKFQFSGQFSCG